MIDIIILLIVGSLGVFAHWLKKWARGQTKAAFTLYMIKHKKHSVASVTTLLSSIVGLYASGDVEMTRQILATVFLTGYFIDSVANKSPEDV